jgi:hypothetical protein
MALKLYHLTRRKNDADYHEYTDFVVVAASKLEALRTFPDGRYVWSPEGWRYPTIGVLDRGEAGWPRATYTNIVVTHIGDAAPGISPGVICASNVGA